MKVAFLTAIFLPILCNGEEVDMLRFNNGDQLHGSFSGVTEGSSILWKREDVGSGVVFSPSEIRQVVLRGGRPKKSLRGLSHIGTVNGDRIPGTIHECDGKRILLDTEFAGMLEIPRDQVGLLAPSPLGGRILYNGPFASDEWEMVSIQDTAGEFSQKDNPAKDEEKEKPLWKFSGAAWYWQDQDKGTALIKKSGVPDRAIIRFDIAWKSRPSMAVAFHSDFTQPDIEKIDENKRIHVRAGQPTSLPGIFGNSYVLNLYSNYVMLYRTAFDEEGNPRPEQVSANNTSIRLGDSGSATIELRCNRISGEIVLFIDGEFVSQWSELTNEDDITDGYAGLGDGMGFVVQSDNSPVRISEIMVAEWNGMPDGARSLQAEDADIVLLSNGTDRFAGNVTGIQAGILYLESRYGDFEFPMDDVAEIRFAKSRTAEVDHATVTDESVMVRLYPLGRISGKPLSGDGETLRFLNGAVGEFDMNMDSAVMLEFEPSGSFLDDWDIDF